MLLASSKLSLLARFDKLLEFQILLEEDNEFTKEDPIRVFDWVKLKLSFESCSVIGDILRAHRVWFAKDRFSFIELS
jgi:hypothetical protein